MSDWQAFAPIGGWSVFPESVALTDALWAQFPEAEWFYLSFTPESSIWESRLDSSMVRVHYAGERVVELEAQAGVAREVFTSLAGRFQLDPVADTA